LSLPPDLGQSYNYELCMVKVSNITQTKGGSQKALTNGLLNQV